MSGLLQLPHTDSKGNGEGDHTFSMDDVWGPVHTTQRITILYLGLLVHMATQVSGDTE